MDMVITQIICRYRSNRFTNAGKSTLLSTISNANQKLGIIHLQPYILYGTVKRFDKEIVLADIPGLIEGAHEEKVWEINF